MSIQLPFSNNAIQVFAYERFSYVISNPNIATYPTMLNVSNTTGFGPNPSPFYFTKTGNTSMTFDISDLSNNLTAGTTESFKVTVTDGSASLVSSNTVSIGPGRFLDGSGASLSNNVYTFFKNEAITPIRLVAPSFTLSVPISIPSLPPGLSFSSNASNEYRIVGTPSLPINATNYQIIGVQSGGSKIVTTRFNIIVSNERLRVDLSGSSIISNMQIDTAIATRVITAIPPVTTPLASIRYTFPVLPDGIVAKNSAGVVQSSGFSASDASYTMIIEGTPSLTAANAFKNAGADSNGLLYTVTATRFNPLPALSNTIPLTFQFAPTVLFDTPTIDPIYVGVPVDQTTNFFVAKTYFISNFGLSDISSIFSPNLRSDLSLVYVPGSSRADLSGNNPLSVGTATFTIRAINSNGIQRDLSQVIVVQNDAVTFNTPPTPIADTCYTFILSRPLTSFKDGYYTSNIQFSATADSGLPVTLAAPGFAGTGLSLDANGFIVGIPSQVTPLTTLSVIADVTGSPATATRNIKFSIVNDTFTFANVAASNLNFIENVPITPVRFPVTTLSDRNVIGYSLSGFPAGLTIDPTGLVSGTPTSSSPTAGNVTITATTGYTSGSRDFSYNIIPDAILFTTDNDVYSFVAGESNVSIQVKGTTYSGGDATNYGLSLDTSFGLTINPITGLITGTLTDSIPPNGVLPASQSFTVTGEINDLSDAGQGLLLADPIIQNTSFMWSKGDFYSSNPTNSWVRNSLIPNTPAGFDIVIKNSNVDGNFILAAASNVIYRATNANLFSGVTVGGSGNGNQLVSSLTFKPGTTTWWASGSRVFSDTIRRSIILQSDDNGVSWYPLTGLKSQTGFELVPRDSNASSGGNPYLLAGVALKYKDGVIMAGGITDGAGSPTMIRSIDDGVTWNNVSVGEFAQESAYFNFDVSGMWIATGSSGYKSVNANQTYSSATDTIKYSTDSGGKWLDATGGFTMYGYELVYANNVWVASGVDGLGSSDYRIGLKYSTDGSNWSNVTGVPSIDVSASVFEPTPVARYDFNDYTAGATTIANQIAGPIGAATVRTPTLNTFITSDPLNKHLQIYGPAIYPTPTGAIVTPSVSGVYSVEMWVRLDTDLGAFGQYFLDFRTGLNGFMIGSVPGDPNNGPGLLGQSIYYNTVGEETTATSPNAIQRLYNTGWNQVVVVFTAPFTAAMTFFARFANEFNNPASNVQSSPIKVADISIYTTQLSTAQIIALYNSKRSRYSLPYIIYLTPSWIAPLPIGSMNYDGSNWNVFRHAQDASGIWTSRVYSSPDIAAATWTSTSVSSAFVSFPNDDAKRFVTYTRPQYLRPSASRVINVTFQLNPGLGVGPIVSPQSSSFLLYQYVAASLQLSATGTGQIYFFISAADLPPGLTFNPVTGIISGKPAEPGTFSTRVYAKDDAGITSVTYTFTVNIPRIIRKQDGAGAYTSLLKQYTEVLAAQSARDSRALPTQLTRLGEFMSPVPVAVTTKIFSTNCQNCLREECPAANAIVDANGAFSILCDFIDANNGEVFDAGNAAANICD
jgi:hypothetical protein